MKVPVPTLAFKHPRTPSFVSAFTTLVLFLLPHTHQTSTECATSTASCNREERDYVLLHDGVPSFPISLEPMEHAAFKVMVSDSDRFLLVVLSILQKDGLSDAMVYVNSPPLASIAKSSCSTWCSVSHPAVASPTLLRLSSVMIMPNAVNFSMGWYSVGVQGIPPVRSNFYVTAFTGKVLEDGVGVSGEVFYNGEDRYSPTANYVFNVVDDLSNPLHIQATGAVSVIIYTPLLTQSWVESHVNFEVSVAIVLESHGPHLIRIRPASILSSKHRYTLSVSHNPAYNTKEIFMAEPLFLAIVIMVPVIVILAIFFVVESRCRTRQRRDLQRIAPSAAPPPPPPPLPPVYIVFSVGEVEPHVAFVDAILPESLDALKVGKCVVDDDHQVEAKQGQGTMAYLPTPT